MQPQQFIDLVQSAFFDLSNVARSQAESVLLQYKDQCTDEFMKYSAAAFANRGLAGRLRIACSTLVKRLVGLQLPNSQVIWLACTPQTKNEVKLKFMEQLVDPENDIRRSAANTISEICAIELPRQEWPDLIQSLTNNTKHKEVQIRVSAIMTLGYICESLKNHQSSGISPQDSQLILMGICFGMDQQEQNVEIKLTAIKALQDSLYFMNNLFTQQEIFTYVKNLIFLNAVSQVKEVKLKSLQCLIDFVKQLFIYTPVYLGELYNTTQPSFENQGEISIAAIEIWNTIWAEMKEITQANSNQKTQESQAFDHCVQFLKQNFEGFTVPFMTNLLIDAGDDEDSQGLSVPDSSCKGLAYVIEFAGMLTLPSVTNFITNTIQNPAFEYKKAGVMAFGALAEVQSQDIEVLIRNALTSLFSCLIDSNLKVKKATAQALTKVAENYYQCFLEHDRAKDMLATLLDQLNNKVSIVTHLMWVFVNLTEGLMNYPNSVFYSQRLLILQHLASTAVRTDIKDTEVALIDISFMGILNIIYSMINPDECKQFMSQFFQQLQMLQKANKSECKVHLEMGLMSCMHGCLVRLDSHHLNDQEVDLMFDTLLALDPTVKNDSFYVISGVAYCLKRKISKYCQKIITELNKPLQEPDDMESFKTALFCLADLGRAMEDDFEPYMNILNYFFGLIQSPNFNRELKIQVYNAIADIILGVKNSSIKYIGQVKEILKVGFAASIDLTNSRVPVDQDYAERLKETMVAFYTCMLHAFCEIDQPHSELTETISWFFIFCQKMCDLKLKPTIEYVRLTLGCIFDCINFFKTLADIKRNIKDFVTSNFVIELLKKLNTYNAKEYKECVQYAKELLSDQFAYQLKFN